MRKLTICIVLTTLLFACKKSLQTADDLKQATQEIESKKSPPSANPAFAYVGSLYFSDNSNSDAAPALYVMDVNGANATLVYTNYVRQKGAIVAQFPSFPSWNSDGSKLCFTLNYADVYTLDISVADGIPVGSNATKIGDGVTLEGNYKQSKWRPGQNQVASVFKKTNYPDEIHLLSASGGSMTILHTAPTTDWIIEDDIAFKSDGSRLVFSERQVSTGIVYLNILDVTNGQVVISLDMSQFSSVVKTRRIVSLDWAKTYGSNIVALTTMPQCDVSTTIGRNGIHQLFTIDVSSASPSLTWIKNDVGVISFSPNDSKIKINNGLARFGSIGGTCSISTYSGASIYTFATQVQSLFPVIRGGYTDVEWKR